ncbi:type II toxin-antitoxin system RelE/ParE family toxin [Paenibacillus oralis]|uniref:type II toxin-antitoxin system RelE/ParE family toxin n=2 Tax=Paenibacillus TaxID=44249 RepID=UPI002482B605|nr:type II toxin-antitoxin system RelE/ParE family toxin [Paenibacillus oralis]
MKRGYQFIVVYPYLVFYRVIENTVIIHRILHGRRDYLVSYLVLNEYITLPRNNSVSSLRLMNSQDFTLS